MKLVILLAAALVVAGIVENARHSARVKKIPVRILVNGTRGKTSVTRLIAAALREAGFRVWGKSTGTEAMLLLPDGTEKPVVRRHGADIREQIPFTRMAARDGANALVVECMAIHPETQRAISERLVKPTLVAMTNARVDHVAEIGATQEETVRSLAFSIPAGTPVVTGDARFAAYADKVVPLVEDALEEDYLRQFRYPMFEDNLRLALTVCEKLGVARDVALRGMLGAAPDLGMAGPFRHGAVRVVNGFAANDPDSCRTLFARALEAPEHAGLPVEILYNNRADREYRLREFLPLVRELADRGATLTVVGAGAEKVCRYYRKRAGLACAAEKSAVEWLQGRADTPGLLLCMGNIKGPGRELIEFLLDKGEK